MKTICIDIYNCGYYGPLEEDDEFPEICPDCFGPVINVDKWSRPLLFDLEDQEKIDEILLNYYKLFNPPTK